MKRSLIGAACVALVVALGACSSSSKGASGGTTASTAASSGGSTADTGPAGSQSGGSTLAFSTSNQHDAHVNRSGQTILIGVENDDQGSFAFPTMHNAMDAAIKDINANGGIDGAQLREDFCSTDGTPESAINCANRLVGDHVALVTYGLEIAAAGQTPIFAGAGIPLIVNVNYDPKVSSDIWQTGPPISAYSLYQMLALKDLGSKHPGYLGTADSTHQNQAKQMQAWGKIAGFDPVIAPFQNPTNADWSTAVQTAVSNGADGFNFGLVENDCTAIVSAASQIGFKGPIDTTCSQFVNTLPHSSTANTYLSAQGYLPGAAASAPSQIQRNMTDYVKAMTAVGLASQVNTAIEDQYSTTEDIATLLRTISAPQITASAIKTALGVNQNLPGFDGPDFNCGAKVWPGNPQACYAYVIVYKNTFQNGQLVLVPILKTNNGFFYEPQYAAQSASVP